MKCKHCGQELDENQYAISSGQKYMDYNGEQLMKLTFGYTEQELTDSKVLHCRNCHNDGKERCIFIRMPDGRLFNRDMWVIKSCASLRATNSKGKAYIGGASVQ